MLRFKINNKILMQPWLKTSGNKAMSNFMVRRYLRSVKLLNLCSTKESKDKYIFTIRYEQSAGSGDAVLGTCVIASC